MCALWSRPWEVTLSGGHDIPLGFRQLRELSSQLKMPVNRYSQDMNFDYMYTDLDLGDTCTAFGQDHDTPLSHQLCETSRSNTAPMSYGPDKDFAYVYNVNFDLRDMTLVQGHDTPLCHGQQLCEIISRSNSAVRRYCLDKDFGYVCTVTLTFEIWLWAKVMAHLWSTIVGNIVQIQQGVRSYSTWSSSEGSNF